MPEDIKVLSARREYSYAPDALRLTMLCTPVVIEKLTQAFSFNVAVVAKPMPTFGEVLNSVPPGLVLNTGSFLAKSAGTIPIRFLHFELTRMVVDLAAPTPFVDEFYERLREVITGFKAPDGSEVLGEPLGRTDYSELSARLSIGAQQLIAPALLAAINEDFGPALALPTVAVGWHASDQPFSPPQSQTEQVVLQPRGGVDPGERWFFSSAPLPTNAHAEWLQSIEDAFAPEKPPRSTGRSRGSIAPGAKTSGKAAAGAKGRRV